MPLTGKRAKIVRNEKPVYGKFMGVESLHVAEKKLEGTSVPQLNRNTHTCAVLGRTKECLLRSALSIKQYDGCVGATV